MLAQGALAATGLAAVPGAAIFTVMQAGFGSFALTGYAVTLAVNLGTPVSMKVVRDAWDVDEWGRFFPGGGMRYTL